MKLHSYWISYSIFVNGTEYPKRQPFNGRTPEEAQKSLEDKLKKAGNNDYHISKPELIK